MSSTSFAVDIGSDHIEFSVTNNRRSLAKSYPIWIPFLSGSMLEGNSAPFSELRRLQDKRLLIETVGALIESVFLKTDFCFVREKKMKELAIFQIDAIYGLSSPLILCVLDSQTVACDFLSGFKRLCFDHNDKDLILRIGKWCVEQYWRLFVVMVEGVCGMFDFRVEEKSHDCIVIGCDGERKVKFYRRDESCKDVFVAVSENEMKMHMKWDSIPVLGHLEKLSYLFFVNFMSRKPSE
jgi:hypothetical protein